MSDAKREIADKSDKKARRKGFPPDDPRRKALGGRISQLIGNESQTEVGRRIGVSQGTVSSYLIGSTEPSWSILLAFADVYGCSIQWLMTGEGPRMERPQQTTGRSSDVLTVPYYNVRASAGPGAFPLEEEPLATFPVDRRFARTLGITSSNVAALTVHGDSAQPNLSEGDVILVDRSYTDLRDGGLYVIGVDDDIVVKRVHRQMDRSIILKSDNPAYEPQHVSAADAEHLRIIGRVRWALRGY